MSLEGAGKGAGNGSVAQSTRMEMKCFVRRKSLALQRRWVCARVGVQTPQEQPWMPGKISFVHLISGKLHLHARCLSV